MAKETTIGFLYDGRIGREEKLFQELSEKNKLKLVMLNTQDDINEEFLKKVEKCNIIFNNSIDPFAIEILKTLEEMGKKTIEKADLYYHSEDKWLFYLKCKEHNIPTIKTILLSENIAVAKKELKNFNEWPVVLKRIEGSTGKYVEKADNIQQAEKVINNFWKKGSEKLPIIAQEFISSPSFRVTVIDNKIVQTVIKKNTHWKATGVQGASFEKFEVDSDLKKIVEKIMKAVKINVCGIDFLKKDNKWLALEVNAEPGLDFIDKEEGDLIQLILTFLKKSIKK